MVLLSSNDEISQSIRQEIIRFESVHPSIYAIYDLVDAVEDKILAESLKHLVVSIEDAFVNSQEWTLSHNVPDIKLGLLGSVNSGKSALVHRYLTGTYLHEESPEGGRFKKEVSLENQSHLLLIRDEGGPPDYQFSHWVDGVIFVFSLENYESYQTVYEYYSRLSTYRNINNLPILLVGTQESNCESYVRVIDDVRARKLANELKRCVYYETCAAYGLNVERVFQDACLKVLQARSLPSQYQLQRPGTPQSAGQGTSKTQGTPILSNSNASASNTSINDKVARPSFTSTANVRHPEMSNPGFEPDLAEEAKGENSESLTPSSTPTHSRKNRRKSNLFQKKNDDERDRDKKLNGIGSGRAIPLKQGFLYKRTCKPLSKEWRTKKYVTLTDDARLTYHPSIHDYMENAHGKEIDLSRTTLKIPGVPFRQVGGRITSNGLLRTHLSDANSDKPFSCRKTSASPDDILASADLPIDLKDSTSVKKKHRRVKPNTKNSFADGYDSEGYEFQLISVDHQWHFEAKSPEDRDDWVMCIERAIMTRLQLNESNKRTRAVASSSTTGIGSANTLYSSSSNVAGSRATGDRNSLTSSRSPIGDVNEAAVTEQLLQSIRAVPGNDHCADCGAPDPDWASLNLGAMVCISCSGIHRQLGTHISRVRSLHLDEWSTESIAVMCSIGNTLANSVWEAAVPVNAGNRKKPGPSSSREEKEVWIRAKYDRQEFLPPLPYPDAPLQQQLIDAIARQDTRQVVLCLALATPETVNAPYSRQDPRAAIHIAATLGNLVYLQLLLWYNGDPTVTDHEGRNAYYYAHCSQKYDCAEFLRRNGCPKQLIPPNLSNTVLPAGRSVLPAAFSHQLSMSGPQLQAIHVTAPYPSNVSMDVHGAASFGNPVLLPPALAQPYHFSHLQQHQQQKPIIQSTHPLVNQLPATIESSVLTSSVSLAALPPTQTCPSVATSQSVSSSHSAMLQSVSSLVTSVPRNTSPSGIPSGLTSRPSGSGHQITSISAPYIANSNQALGATLPRRRAPPPSLPQSAQPFLPTVGQQLSASSGAHRPFSGACADRLPTCTAVRPCVSAAAPPSHVASTYNRIISDTSVSAGKHTLVAQPYASSNHEVGL